jgi:hypothetical protein
MTTKAAEYSAAFALILVEVGLTDLRLRQVQ